MGFVYRESGGLNLCFKFISTITALSLFMLPVEVFAVDVTDVSIREGSTGNATVTISAPAGPNGQVILFETANGTANGADFSVSGDRITIPSGATTGGIPIIIVDDGPNESLEQFSLGVRQDLVLNSGFQNGNLGFTALNSSVEVRPETTYGGSDASNDVLEIDSESQAYQDITITPGVAYRVSFLASRRTASSLSTPATVDTAVAILDQNNLSNVIANHNITRSNTTFNLTQEVFTIPATNTVADIRIQLTTTNTITSGMIIDNLSIVRVNTNGGPLPASDDVATISIIDQVNIVYAGNFTETVANDGSVTGSRVATLTGGDAFVGVNGSAMANVIVSNVPPGLTAVATKTSDTVVTVTLTGNATDHETVDDINDLTITFDDGAFVYTPDASDVTNNSDANGTVSFINAPNASNSSISVTANNAVANGIATNTVQVTVRDVNNNIVPNSAVTVALTGTGSAAVGSILGTTDALGQLSIHLTSTTAEILALGYTVNGAAGTGSAVINFIAGVASTSSSSIAVIGNNALADGIATNTVQVTVRDVNNNIVPNSAVTVALTGTGSATVAGIPGVTDGSGQLSINLTSTTAESLTVGYTIEGMAGGGTVNVIFVVRPSVSIWGAPDRVNTVAIFTVTIQFSSAMTGFTLADILVSRGVASNFIEVNGATYTVNITPDGSGDITLDIPAGVAQDIYGNDNTAAHQVRVVLDSDGDGVSDEDEQQAGTDPQSSDTDRDGVPDDIELGPIGAPLDSDGDGVIDAKDPDDDNDGIPTALEDPNFDGDHNPSTGVDLINGDTDGDGVPNYLDLDSDGDGIPDAIENGDGTFWIDADADGIIDSIDADKDGSPGVDANVTDANADGVIDTILVKDSDSDGLPDYLDLDSDNDGITDSAEADVIGVANGLPSHFTGGLDTNHDGINDAVLETTDTDADGVPDRLDLDSDNDSLFDVVEAGLADPDEDARAAANEQGTVKIPLNTDGVDQPDYRDLDSNNDGVFDIASGFFASADSNGDGVVDSFLDLDGDGNFDVIVNDNNTDATIDRLLDADRDGIKDLVDQDITAFGNLNDTDRDGVPDSIDQDDDNDGIPDAVEDNLELLNSLPAGSCLNIARRDCDGDGIPNSRDLDSDNDGIPDSIEAYNSSAIDIDGDGVIDDITDSDGDGLADVVDPDVAGPEPFELLNTDGGFVEGGDLIPNFLDTDSDGDGISDEIEARDLEQDADGDGLPNYIDTDSDNDGLEDRLEMHSGSRNRLSADSGRVAPISGSSGVSPVALLMAVILIAFRRRGDLIKRLLAR